MKHWKISYSIRFVDGKEEEREATIEARNIASAISLAYINIVEPTKKLVDVGTVVIWHAGIIEDDVFPEEGDGYDPDC